MSLFLNNRIFVVSAIRFIVFTLGLLAAQRVQAAELRPKTLKAWETYVRFTERRIAAELGEQRRFLVTDFLSNTESQPARVVLRNGQVYIRKMKTPDETGQEFPVEDGMIHHWMGSIFVPGITLDSLIRWVQDYDHHDRYFQEVEKSKLRSRDGSSFQIFLRLRRKKIITVYYNTEHTVLYRSQDAKRVSSRSFTTRIAELDDAGTPQEKEKPIGNDSGFLWRLNSYWRFQEQDGGVIVECESVSISRAIPFGLGWLVRGYVESVPRESLENTLTSLREGAREAIRLGAPGGR